MKIKWLITLVLALCVSFTLFGSGTPHYTFREGTTDRPYFNDSLLVFIDNDSKLQLEDILKLQAAEFGPIENDKPYISPASIWTRVTLTNKTTGSLQQVFRFYKFVDSIWMYTLQAGEIKELAFTGFSQKPLDKTVPSPQNSLPFTLYEGETKTFYVKLKFNESNCSNSCHIRLRTMPAKTFELEEQNTVAAQSFYAGLMLLLSLVSIILFYIFRERFFLWYSLLMCAFTAYFLTVSNTLELLFNFYENDFSHSLISHFAMGIVAFASLFVVNYLNLSGRNRKLHLGYLGVALGVCLFPYLAKLFISPWNSVALISDRLTLCWTLLSIGIIIWSTRQGDRASKILLASTLGLALGAIVYILGLGGTLPSSPITNHSFQMGTVLFSGVLFYGMFERINSIRSEKARMEELDELKSKFFANISHEFRTPLTLVMGPIKDVLENTKSPQDRGRLKLAYSSAERLLQLINQLLDLSKLESNKMQLRTSEYNLADILKGISMSFESLATRKHIQYNFIAQKEYIPVYVDKDKVENIFFNLLSNAFKFTEENGEISVLVTDNQNHVEVMVRDTGMGIAEERLPDIFNRFFQGGNVAAHDQEGTGIGLALVKELVELHSGEVRVESKEGEGSTFTVAFQKGSAHLEPHEIVNLPDEESAASSEVNAGAALPEALAVSVIDEVDVRELPIVLIIEDNAAVRNYIKDFLVNSFRIVEATNGQEGIDKAFEILPDLIISDVMMPQKDGYEVCATLKTDERTSHIPVILLTAKVASEEKLKGLETGADDYLIKPFDTRELGVRVRNLIDSRTNLRKKFSESEGFETQQASFNKLDQAFLKKVHECIEAYLSDEQFGVEFLAQEVGLSRSQLNRKLRALTDMSPNKLIQSVRLQKAKAMLLAGAGSVSEVAFETGFNSTAYFVKCFGDKYGQTPGSLLAQ